MAQVPSLVGELRSHKLCSKAKKKGEEGVSLYRSRHREEGTEGWRDGWKKGRTRLCLKWGIHLGSRKTKALLLEI